MNSLHYKTVDSAPSDTPTPSRQVEQPYGMMFGENKAGTSIHIDKNAPFHLLFLLKGAACIKTSGKETHIAEDEFLLVDSASPVECICTHSSHYVLICLDEAFPSDMDVDTEFSAAQAQPIHTDLSVLLRYLMGTMPLNEMIDHHFIPRIVRTMMRTYSYVVLA